MFKRIVIFRKLVENVGPGKKVAFYIIMFFKLIFYCTLCKLELLDYWVILHLRGWFCVSLGDVNDPDRQINLYRDRIIF